jgi:phosphomannomutase/phosphoglucomutase
MSAWKACDLRGPAPSEVSPELFRRIGRAVAAALPPAARVLVAGDFRLSTPELKRALVAGLGGLEVLDAGQIPTPVAYFAHKRFRTDGVLIVTASHNPPDHNGLKLMLGALPPLPEDFERLRRLAEEAGSGPEGSSRPVDPVPAYRQWMEERWRGGPALRVVLDAGNGAWSRLGPEVFSSLGFDVAPLFCEIDGRFPNRAPDPARAENLSALCAEVKRSGAALGIAWDGDGDRVAFADETGRVVRADEMAVLLARRLLQPGDKMVYDIKLSDVVRRAAAGMGAVPLMERSGHSFIKRRMIEENGALGCEISGHYFYRELGGGDDGLFTALLVSRMVSEWGPLGELRKSVPPIFATPDLRIPAAEISYTELTARLRRLFPAARVSSLDGLRLETGQGFVLARQSVTEAAVTLRLEGFSRKDFEALRAQCLDALPEVARSIQEQSERA